MKTTDIVSDDALLSLTPEQRARLADLIEIERKSATRWWTFLNEMRLLGALPDWVSRGLVGTHSDLERYEAQCEAMNRALFGKKKYIRSAGEPISVSAAFGVDRPQCTSGGRA